MDGQGYSTLEVRVRAVKAVQGGMAVGQAARAHGVDRTTLHRWLRRHHEDGNLGLQRRPVSGRPRKLQSINGYHLKRIVMAPASRYGFKTDLWTVGRVHAVLVDRFNDDLSEDTVWRRLREIGLTWQTPERQYFEADPEIRRRWQEETIPKIRETLQKTGGNPVLRRRGVGLPDTALGQDLGGTRQAAQGSGDRRAGQHRGHVRDQPQRPLGVSTSRKAHHLGGGD